MGNVEPSLELENVNGPALAAEPAQTFRYPIACGSGIYRRRDEYRARSFEAVGEMVLVDGQVQIHASTARLFKAKIETDLRFGLHDTFNVVATGKLIRFEASGEDGRLRMVLLRAQSRREAREIATRLPDTKTPAFVAESEALESFLDGVETLTPHVWVTWAIIALNVLVYAFMLGSGGGFPKIRIHSAIAFGSNFGPDTVNGEFWRLLTAAFVHLSFAHLVLNMLVLGYVGIIVERLYGNVRFTVLYVFAGVSASLASLYLHYWLNSAGASGAIFGTLGALLAYVIRFRSMMPRTIHAKRFRVAAWLVIYSLLNGVTHPAVDNASHLGGLIAGFAMGWILAQPVDQSKPAMDARHAGTLACVLAALVFAALGWQTARETSTPDAREEMAFAVMVAQSTGKEEKAMADMKALVHLAQRTPSKQGEAAAQLRTTVWAQWNALYEAVNHTPLPAASPRAPFREALLRYYDDMSQAMIAMADLATVHATGDSPQKRKLTSLLEQARRQRIAAVRFALRQ